ncbi:MAG: hypothetical protein AAGD96_25850 [Chloroflexota bacterium]
MNKENPMWRLNTTFLVIFAIAYAISLILPMFHNGDTNILVIFVLVIGIFNIDGFGLGFLAIFANILWVIAAFMHLDQKYTQASIFGAGGVCLALLMFTMREVDFGILGGPFQVDDLSIGYGLWLLVLIGLPILSLVGHNSKSKNNAAESISEITSDEPKEELE